ncbi:MAG: hypothetical protein SV186_01070 [Candidatus Nanohaloarchaea archaeon]|nr:hypothetical protein [Candidatus Nanohaloarchaea archaeon]
MSESFKLKGGQKEYDNYINALKVAEAKAEQKEEPVEVCKKELEEYNELVRVFPDGSQEKLEN